jgi:hypothetical protein
MPREPGAASAEAAVLEHYLRTLEPPPLVIQVVLVVVDHNRAHDSGGGSPPVGQRCI